MIVLFFNKAVVEENTDADSCKFPWILKESLICEIDGKPFVIPAGLKTDFASIPPAVNWFQQSFGPEINKAALLHDAWYAAELFPRGYIDTAFRAALDTCKMPGWKANICWAAVRMFGGFTYGEHTLSRIKKIRELAHIAVDVLKRPLWKNITEAKQEGV